MGLIPFATDDTYTEPPFDGQPTKTAPDESKQASGFLPDEPIPIDELNYLLHASNAAIRRDRAERLLNFKVVVMPAAITSPGGQRFGVTEAGWPHTASGRMIAWRAFNAGGELHESLDAGENWYPIPTPAFTLPIASTTRAIGMGVDGHTFVWNGANWPATAGYYGSDFFWRVPQDVSENPSKTLNPNIVLLDKPIRSLSGIWWLLGEAAGVTTVQYIADANTGASPVWDTEAMAGDPVDSVSHAVNTESVYVACKNVGTTGHWSTSANDGGTWDHDTQATDGDTTRRVTVEGTVFYWLVSDSAPGNWGFQVFRSTDGLVWDEIASEDNAAVVALGAGRPHDLAVVDGVLVIVCDAESPVYGHPIIYSVDDGATWELGKVAGHTQTFATVPKLLRLGGRLALLTQAGEVQEELDEALYVQDMYVAMLLSRT